MGKTTHAKVVIIGSGPAGYTAAIYAARAMLEPVLIQGIQPGGQLTITTDVENYPGFADVIQGPWLMEQMQKQAEHVGTQIVTDHVDEVDLSRRPFRLEATPATSISPSADHRHRRAGALAGPAVGAEVQGLRRLGLRHLRRLLLSRQGSVRDRRRQHRRRGGAVPHQFRRPRSRSCTGATASAPRRSCRTACSRIRRSRWSGTACSTEVTGDDKPAEGHAASCCATSRPARSPNVPADGVFIAIGHTPATELFDGQIEMKPAATSRPRRIRPRPRCRACSRPATSRTTSTARR